jgi:hypothetical protein
MILASLSSTSARMVWANSPGVSSAGIHLPHGHRAVVGVLAQVDAQPVHAREEGVLALVEDEHRRALAPSRGGRDELGCQRGLAGAGRADDERARAALEPAAQEVVHRVDAAGEFLLVEVGAVFGRDKPRVDAQAAGEEVVVVVAAAEAPAAMLQHAKPAPVRSVFGQQLLQHEHAVRDRLHLQVAPRAGEIVEQQHGTTPPAEELLQRQQLPAVSQRVAGKKTQFRRANRTPIARASGARRR